MNLERHVLGLNRAVPRDAPGTFSIETVAPFGKCQAAEASSGACPKCEAWLG